MLQTLTLKNFRQHRDRTIVFGGGLTALRGANEAGKSSVLLAIAYALYGVKSLPDSLEDTVTWGEAVGTLKVTLTLAVDGVTYTVARGKGGAEVNYDGGVVTGQNECSNFLANLLKVDSGSATRLTMSNQLAIRGALEAGPKATTELIEKLADFDVIDQLIDLMQEKLTLGSTAVVEASIESSKSELERATEAAVPVNTAAWQTNLIVATEELQAASEAAQVAESVVQAAQEAHSVLRESIVARNSLVQAMQTSSSALRVAQEKLANIEVPAKPDNIAGQVEALQTAITNVEQMDRIRGIHAVVAPYLQRDPSALAYEGTYGDLATEIEAMTAKRAESVALIAQLKGDIRVNEAALTHGSCTFCGKDFSGVPEVAAKNAKLATQIENDKGSKAVAEAVVAEADAELPDLKAVLAADGKATLAAAGAGEFVTQVLDGTLPRIYTWTGPELKDTVTVKSLRAEIAALQAQQTAYDKAVVRKSEAVAQVTVAQTAYDNAKAAVDAAPEVTLGDAQERLDNAKVAADEARASVIATNRRLSDIERGMRDAVKAYEDAVKKVGEVRERLDQQVAQLATTEFNNALLKRVRQCRPLISDKLWNIVLAAVSSYFSDIRGVKSKVTKDSSGFKVDDHPITSMSGSTLDALGLAIRVALVRTFLPSAPFLILDEPSAAMDSDRTGNMLGFLAGCGFHQILVVSHEEISTDVADHLITL